MTLMFHFRASCKRFEAWPLAGTRRLRSSHEADLETLRGSELDLFFVISWLFVFLVLLMVLFIWYLCVTNSFAYSVPYRITSNHIISIHIHIHYHIISCHIISYHISYIYIVHTRIVTSTHTMRKICIYIERESCWLLSWLIWPNPSGNSLDHPSFRPTKVKMRSTKLRPTWSPMTWKQGRKPQVAIPTIESRRNLRDNWQ